MENSVIAAAPTGSELVSKSERIAQLIGEFIAAQDVKPSSKQVYARTLKQFFKWIAQKCYAIAEITHDQINEYKEDLLAAGKSALTVASYVISVRKFYEYAEARKYYQNVAKGVKCPRRTQTFRKQPLTADQAKQLLDYFRTTQTLRDYAIINLLLHTGLRTIEIRRANIGDITFKGGQRVLLVQGKGRDEKDNFVVLTDKTYKPISDYLKTRNGAADTEPLFVTNSYNDKNARISTRTFSLIAKEGLKAIGLDAKCFTAHSLRHTTAVNILRAGGSDKIVQLTLRHANPATTQIYTAFINEERRLANSGEALLDALY